MSKHLNPLEKEFLIHKYKENRTVKMRDFCLVNSVSEASLKKWIKQYDAAGLVGLDRADAETADCLNLKKVDTFGSNTKSKNETKDRDTTGVQ